MSFLNSNLFLLLLPLAALPLIIHLLNKRFPKLFRFSSIENIKEVMARRARLHRWRHLILLLLRTAFLLLLLLAFLKPVAERFGSHASDPTARSVLIMLDHSLSMEHHGDGPSSRQRAQHAAETLLQSLRPEDAVNVVLIAHNPATCFVDFSRNHAEAKRFVRSLGAGLTRADVNQANAVGSRLIARARDRPEIHYISDFQRKNWSNADFSGWPERARVFFHDVAPSRKDNHAIVEARVSQGSILAGDTVPLEVTVANYAENPLQSRLAVVVDKRLSFDQEVFVPPWSVGKTALPIPVSTPGLHQCEITLPADGLEADNRFFLTMFALEKEEVLIVSDAPAERQDAAYFLKTALNPFSSGGGSLLPVMIRSGDLSATRLAGVQKMFFTHLGPLRPEAAALVRDYLFRGGGLIYFLDGASDPANLALLEKACGTALPLKLAAKRAAANLAAGAQQIVRGDFKSRFLKLFRGATRQDLALLEFYDYYQASATGQGEVILTYADESPAMATFNHGLGTLILLNFSAGELSGNLARQRIFPAWIQELTKSVATDEPPPAFQVIGETVQTDVWRRDVAEFKSPSGQATTARRDLQGDRYRITFVPDQLGFYTMGAPKPVQLVAVNPHADEADLRQVDRGFLPSQLQETQQGEFIHPEDYDEIARGRPLFHWFLLAAVLFLMAEAGLQLRVAGKVRA